MSAWRCQNFLNWWLIKENLTNNLKAHFPIFLNRGIGWNFRDRRLETFNLINLTYHCLFLFYFFLSMSVFSPSFSPFLPSWEWSMISQASITVIKVKHSFKKENQLIYFLSHWYFGQILIKEKHKPRSMKWGYCSHWNNKMFNNMMSKNACFTGDYRPCIILFYSLHSFSILLSDRGCSFDIPKSTVIFLYPTSDFFWKSLLLVECSSIPLWQV